MIFRKYCQLFSQLLVLTVCKIIFLPFTKRNTVAVLPDKLKKRPYLIVANHRKGIDPFIITAGLPYKAYLKIAPINYMTANLFYDSILRPFLWLCGCFPAKNPKQRHALYGIDGATRLLASGFGILIFPQGRRVHYTERGQAKYGVIAIHQALPKVPIIVCRVEYKHTGLRIISLNYEIIRKPHFVNPEKVMDRVFMLH